MPNGVDAMASIAVGEGRANRIRDYSSQDRKTGKKAAGTFRSQAAKVRAGMMMRKKMALNSLAGLGKFTHGGGGIESNRITKGGKSNLKQYAKAEKEFTGNYRAGTPYSKARSKTAGYRASKGGVAKGWAGVKVPSAKKIEHEMKRRRKK